MQLDHDIPASSALRALELAHLAKYCSGEPAALRVRKLWHVMKHAGRPGENTSIVGVLRPPVGPGRYTSLAFTDALRDSGIAGSIGPVGDALFLLCWRSGRIPNLRYSGGPPPLSATSSIGLMEGSGLEPALDRGCNT